MGCEPLPPRCRAREYGVRRVPPLAYQTPGRGVVPPGWLAKAEEQEEAVEETASLFLNINNSIRGVNQEIHNLANSLDRAGLSLEDAGIYIEGHNLDPEEPESSPARAVHADGRRNNGEVLVERCRQAWQEGRPARLDFPQPDGARAELEIIAARSEQVPEVQKLILWVRVKDFEEVQEDDLEY